MNVASSVLVFAGWMVVSLLLLAFIILFDRKKGATVSKSFIYLIFSFVIGVALLFACVRLI